PEVAPSKPETAMAIRVRHSRRLEAKTALQHTLSLLNAIATVSGWDQHQRAKAKRAVTADAVTQPGVKTIAVRDGQVARETDVGSFQACAPSFHPLRAPEQSFSRHGDYAYTCQRHARHFPIDLRRQPVAIHLLARHRLIRRGKAASEKYVDL